MSQTSPIRVFVADDDADDRLLIQDAFKENGQQFQMEFFEDGHALLNALENAGSRLPDLILLDLNMPGKDGREVLNDLKSNPAYRRIPVIMLTTSRDDHDINACYELGASSYIVKPVSYDGLLDITRSLKRYWTQTSVLPGQTKPYA